MALVTKVVRVEADNKEKAVAEAMRIAASLPAARQAPMQRTDLTELDEDFILRAPGMPRVRRARVRAGRMCVCACARARPVAVCVCVM